jgi:RNA polymerase sigma-70 factor (ECF subfamily)
MPAPERSGSDGDQRRRFFEAEVERLLDRLYGTAARLTRHGADAEDLVAEALTRAWARLDELRDLQSLEKWLFRILFTTFISLRRRQQARPAEDSMDSVDDEAEFSLFETLHQPFLLWWSNPEQLLLDKLLREDIRQALDTLPADFRLVVVMVEISGFSYAEAADALDVPVGTVRSRLSRGRALLQRALWRQASQLGIAAAAARGDVS